MATPPTEWALNQPIWVCHEYAGFFHYYQDRGMARVGVVVNRTGIGNKALQASIPVEWITEREVQP